MEKLTVGVRAAAELLGIVRIRGPPGVMGRTALRHSRQATLY